MKRKESKYNYFVPYGDRMICFNGISGKVFSVNKNELSIIENLLKNPNIETQLSTFLYNHNFIIDNDLEETDYLIFNNRVAVFDGTYNLIINPTQECCFGCWYCYQSRTSGHMSVETMSRIMKFLDNQVTKRNITGIVLGWFGGEPLLYFDDIIYPLSTYAKELMSEHNLNYSANITTNGYNISKEMIEKFKKIKLTHFQITFDGNEETHNKTRNHNGSPSFNRIIENIIHLCNEIHDVQVTVRVNYTNEILSKDLEVFLNRFPLEIRSKIIVSFHRVWQTSDEIKGKGRDNKDLLNHISKVREMEFNLVENTGYFYLRSHVCYADRYNYAHINFDGKVYKCTARDYNEEAVCGELNENGEIEWRRGIQESAAHPNFENDLCLNCKQLPFCMGPCYQDYQEYRIGKSKKFCHKATNEITTEAIIIEHYKAVKAKHLQK